MTDETAERLLAHIMSLSSAIQMLLEIEMRRKCRDNHLAPAEVTQAFARLADREADAMRHANPPLPPDRRDALIFAAQQHLAGLVASTGNRLHRQPPDHQTP